MAYKDPRTYQIQLKYRFKGYEDIAWGTDGKLYKLPYYDTIGRLRTAKELKPVRHQLVSHWYYCIGVNKNDRISTKTLKKLAYDVFEENEWIEVREK